MAAGVVGLRGHPGGGGAGRAEAVGANDAFPVEISSTSLLADFDTLKCRSNYYVRSPLCVSVLGHAVQIVW